LLRRLIAARNGAGRTQRLIGEDIADLRLRRPAAGSMGAAEAAC
jgi:hypothetical protein